MTPTLRRKLEALAERREELERLLSDPGVVADNERFRKYSREFSQLEPVSTALAEEAKAKRDLAAAEALRSDPEMRELAEEEIASAQARLDQTRPEAGLGFDIRFHLHPDVQARMIGPEVHLTLPTGEPHLPGVRAALRCRAIQVTPVGASSAVIAEVLDVIEGDSGEALIYIDRAFRVLP